MQRGSSASASRARHTTLVAVALLLLAGLLALPRPASAHSTLQRTEPGDGSTLNAPPDRISLVFNEPVWTDYATIAVTAGDGRRLETGAPQVVETTLAVPLRGATTGEYHVAWRVVSSDGHPITGEFVFTVADGSAPAETSAPGSSGDPAGRPATGRATGAGGAAGTTTPPADPAPPREGENWWIIGVSIAALAALGGAALLFRRRSRG